MSAMMYVPPYEALLRSLQTNKEAFELANEITIPAKLLKLLLQLALAQSEFDEKEYLGRRRYQHASRCAAATSKAAGCISWDMDTSRAAGAVPSKLMRNSTWPTIPTSRRLSKKGKSNRRRIIFSRIGAGEGRSPTAEQASDAAEWKMALRGP